MRFYETPEHVCARLRHEGRASYRTLKREFDLDGAYIEDIKEELIVAKQLARDEDGRVLVWAGDAVPAPTARPSETQSHHPPASYTPQHLAERIRAEQAAIEARGNADGEHKTITMWQSQPIKP